MNLQEIVQKLNGEINPVGETNTDNERYENLKNLCELVDLLLGKIDNVSEKRNSPEFSIKRSGEFASKFLKETVGIKAD